MQVKLVTQAEHYFGIRNRQCCCRVIMWIFEGFIYLWSGIIYLRSGIIYLWSGEKKASQHDKDDNEKLSSYNKVSNSYYVVNH